MILGHGWYLVGVDSAPLRVALTLVAGHEEQFGKARYLRDEGLPRLWIIGKRGSRNPLHLGTERNEAVDEARMGAPDRIRIQDRRFTVYRGRHHQQRDRHADDIGTGHRRRCQLLAAEGDEAV